MDDSKYFKLQGAPLAVPCISCTRSTPLPGVFVQHMLHERTTISKLLVALLARKVELGLLWQQ